MSYTVLARKWRPQNFSQLVGQSHVQKALVNAIDHDRLHHAYLFTGTRGIGKTTIARIFSKCLNCETGITSSPCGECTTCLEIEQGRFVDLMEIDAASRTKVEDTREILDNVQYRPSRGRYKVYLIDEVHMLSNSSFNALLKTLEEPPPHVIFLLATTDPQKLPVTVLSRCLQFHLKRMTEQSISEHLTYILQQENLTFEPSSLELVANAADGSMRDALSLLDQAIAFSGGSLAYKDVADMLGAIDQHFVKDLLLALAQNDAKQVLQVIENMAEFSPDFEMVLADLLSALHRLAVAKLIGEEPSGTDDKACFEALSDEDIQLFYQLGLQARKDLGLAPNLKQGFEMAILRMLAFRPVGSGAGNKSNGLSQSQKKNSEPTPVVEKAESSVREPVKQTVIAAQVSVKRSEVLEPQSLSKQELPKQADSPNETRLKKLDEVALKPEFSSTQSKIKTEDNQGTPVDIKTEQPKGAFETKNTVKLNLSSEQELLDPYVWHQWINQLELTGTVFQVLNNSKVKSISANDLIVEIIPAAEHFATALALEKISNAVSQQLKKTVSIKIELGDDELLSPKVISEQQHQENLQKALATLNSNPKVQAILEKFNTQISIDDIQLH